MTVVLSSSRVLTQARPTDSEYHKSFITALMDSALPSLGLVPNQALEELNSYVNDTGFKGDLFRPYISRYLLEREQEATYTIAINGYDPRVVDVIMSHKLLTPEFMSKLGVQDIADWVDVARRHLLLLSRVTGWSEQNTFHLKHTCELLGLICASNFYDLSKDAFFASLLNSIYDNLHTVEDLENATIVESYAHLLNASLHASSHFSISVLEGMFDRFKSKFLELDTFVICGEVQEIEDESWDEGDEFEVDEDEDFDDVLDEVDNLNDDEGYDPEDLYCTEPDLESSSSNRTAHISYPDSFDDFEECEEEDFDESRDDPYVLLRDSLCNAMYANPKCELLVDFWLNILQGVDPITSKKVEPSTLLYRKALDGLACSNETEMRNIIPRIIRMARRNQLFCLNMVYLLAANERLGRNCAVDFMSAISAELAKLTKVVQSSIMSDCRQMVAIFFDENDYNDSQEQLQAYKLLDILSDKLSH